jgi:molecular chaperone DnaK (HSP70)
MISRSSGDTVDRYAHSPRLTVRLGVDFGAGILVVGISDQEGCGYRTVEFPGWSQEMPVMGADGPVHGIPVLIHYDQDGGLTIGDEVERAVCSDQPSAARWIRKYLLEGSPVRIPAGTDRRITFRDAATDFLGTVLARTARELPTHPTVVFSLPPDAPEWYAGWLGSIAHTAGMASCHTLDEHAAAAAGYGLSVEEGQMFLVIRCDETEVTVSVVLCEGSSGPSLSGDLRVTGEACEDTGCRALDGWIAQHMLTRNCMRCTGVKAQRIHDRIIGRIDEVHRQLAAADEAVLDIADPFSGTMIFARVSRDDISRIIADHGFPSVLDRTTDRARAAARAHGCGEETPVVVMMIGRGSAIPAVQELVK